MCKSEVVTRAIRVTVVSRFVPEHSEPGEGKWFFAYRIRIDNESDRVVQLISRHWIITDANGSIEEVKGSGVVGEQPSIEPGDSFEYTSFCPLATPFGTMEGTYQMVTADGERFDARIAPFELSEPMTVN